MTLRNIFVSIFLFAGMICSSAQTVSTTTDTINVVYINYNDANASAIVCDNIKSYVTISFNGAHVSVIQSADVSLTTTGEISYILSGTSGNGSFYLEGSFKSTVALQNLTLTNPSGPAINLQNGKRIEVSVKRGTTNNLTDGTSVALDAWKGCFQCKGHTEFKGYGTLNVYANYAHGIWSKEYITIRNCTINVVKAVKDAINCNQYFSMESGELNLSGFGDDGIQVSLKTDDTSAENTGDFTLSGGTINIDMTGASGSSIKAAGIKKKATTATLNIIGENSAVDDKQSESGPICIYNLVGTKVGIFDSFEQVNLLTRGIYIAVSGQEIRKIMIP